MSTTYTGYQTCPDSCELKPEVKPDGSFDESECYACQNLVGMQMRKLTRASVNVDLVQIQQAETDAIRKLSGDRILRLKVGGDTPNEAYARALADACETYTAKANRPAYCYTHNWDAIARDAFGNISILASCDFVSDIAKAKAKGYATATVVSEFPNGAKAFMLGDHKCIPCPEQCSSEAKPVQCVDCKLCTRDAMLRERNLTVAFIAHGRKAEKLKATLRAKGA